VWTKTTSPDPTGNQKAIARSSGTWQVNVRRGQLKCDGTRAETRFRLSAKRTSPFKSAGRRQFSRLLAADVCASAVVMLDTPCSEVVWRVLATHCIRQFPLHFPSRASPCAITFQLESNTPCRLLCTRYADQWTDTRTIACSLGLLHSTKVPLKKQNVYIAIGCYAEGSSRDLFVHLFYSRFIVQNSGTSTGIWR